MPFTLSIHPQFTLVKTGINAFQQSGTSARGGSIKLLGRIGLLPSTELRYFGRARISPPSHSLTHQSSILGDSVDQLPIETTLSSYP